MQIDLWQVVVGVIVLVATTAITFYVKDYLQKRQEYEKLLQQQMEEEEPSPPSPEEVGEAPGPPVTPEVEEVPQADTVSEQEVSRKTTEGEIEETTDSTRASEEE